MIQLKLVKMAAEMEESHNDANKNGLLHGTIVLKRACVAIGTFQQSCLC